MKAIISANPGGTESLLLKDVPDPTVGNADILLRVHACGINYPDGLIIDDKYQVRPPRPFSPGSEVAGEVLAIGKDIKGFAPGDRVIAIVTHGGMAEKLAVPASACCHIPAEMPWDVAATLIFTYGTSYHALHDRASLKPGEKLLVLGGAGGVGLATVQLGKAAGAIVIAAVSSEEKARLASEAGADHTVIYPTGALDRDAAKTLSDKFKAVLGSGGADVICDTVGGDYSEPALRNIAWNGQFLVIGFPAGIPKIPANLVLLKGCQIVGVFWGSFTAKYPEHHQANNQALLKLWQTGKINPAISARYTLAEAPHAISDLIERRAAGKLVVLMPEEA